MVMNIRDNFHHRLVSNVTGVANLTLLPASSNFFGFLAWWKTNLNYGTRHGVFVTKERCFQLEAIFTGCSACEKDQSTTIICTFASLTPTAFTPKVVAMSSTQGDPLPPYLSWPLRQLSHRISMGSLHSALTAKVLRRKLPIDIALSTDLEHGRPYSTNDEIRGQVILSLKRIIEIVDLTIIFEGKTTTYVNNYSVPTQLGGYISGRHTFLKVAQSVDKRYLADDNSEEAGVDRSFPFTFVVPNRLLPHICSHKIEHSEVKNEHLYLPPTLGDLASSSADKVQMDDMAPAMAKISYTITARATVRDTSGNVVDLAERTRRVRIMPAREEQPPMIFNEQYSNSFLRQEKYLKRGIFKRSKAGRLVVEMTQPRSFRLLPPKEQISNDTITTTSIALRFYPHNSADKPPQLDSIVGKICAYTYFGVVPYDMLPQPALRGSWSSLHNSYSTSVKLSSHCLSAVAWSRRDEVDAFDRLPSAPLTLPEPTSTFYTTTLNIPLSLPNRTGKNGARIFVPTFHSCNVSRCYSLELCLLYHNSNCNILASRVKLNSPIQISSEGLIL